MGLVNLLFDDGLSKHAIRDVSLALTKNTNDGFGIRGEKFAKIRRDTRPIDVGNEEKEQPFVYFEGNDSQTLALNAAIVALGIGAILVYYQKVAEYFFVRCISALRV
jgi:hypothetical protein